jgi:ankyrin repeat protein
MLQILYDYGANLGFPTQSDASMLPIHWAASEGKISSIRFLLDKRQDINAQDGNGCTPVVIATQHNNAACVIYLIKNGADMTLRDSNGDTALHWAAYKGYIEMVGLLTYFMPHEVDSDDVFGQVPLRPYLF